MAFPEQAAFSSFGYQNVFIPGYMGDGESQKKLIVGFTLNEADWALNNIVNVYGADKPYFFYTRFHSPDFSRVPHSNAWDSRWIDGSERPLSQEKPRFVNEPVQLYRHSVHDYLGDWTQDLSEIGPLIPIMQQTFAAEFMLKRSARTVTELTTSTNYPTAGTTHYYADWNALATAASSLGYSSLYFGTAGTNTILDGTINDPFIGKALKHAVITILLRSNGRVRPENLQVIMNPNTANRLANTQEIRAYMAQQARSLEVLQGKEPKTWPTFGLPNPLYGLEVIVDPLVYNTAKTDLGTADTPTFVWPDGMISVITRPGGVAGMPGSVGFGSLALWQHKKWAMRPETFPDPQNHRLAVTFMDAYEVKLVAPEITFTIEDAFT